MTISADANSMIVDTSARATDSTDAVTTNIRPIRVAQKRIKNVPIATSHGTKRTHSTVGQETLAEPHGRPRQATA
jgi:hypothetical protein